jgi:RNA polymerase sigma-70 factor (ECF subfamily)
VHLEDSPELEAVLDALTSGDLDLPEVEAWRHDVGRVVQATLDRLPGRYAEVLEWKYVDELSVNDIADRLAVAPKAAESMLTRARVAFRAAIGTVLQVDDALVPPRPPAAGA